MIRSLLPASALACVLSWSPVASAQPARDPTADIARNHMDNGGRYFHLGRFVDAAREFQSAYDLSRRPELLFNLARALEAGGRDAEAIEAYERFEAAGSPGVDLAVLHARVEALRARAPRAVASPAPAPAVTPPAPLAVAPPRVAPPAAAPARSLALPVTLLGAGGALLVTGLALGLTVSSAYSDLDAACPGRVCDPARQGEADAAGARAVVGDVLGGVGLAAIAAGVVVLLLPRSRESSRAPRVGLACAGDGCAGRVAVTF